MKSLSVALKSVAVKALPSPILQRLRNLAWSLKGRSQGPTVPMDFGVLGLLRNAETTKLVDPAFLEHELLPHLGLNDEGLVQIPHELHRLCGFGLRIWQYPNQFAPYLELLSRLGLRSYLEIGVRHGGTFVCTVEYLSRFQLLTAAVAVDLGPCASLDEYTRMNPVSRFFQMDSHSADFREFITGHRGFDLALIDGDHSELGCWQDFTLVREKAAVIAFHDIVSAAEPGVGAVWRKLRDSCAADYDFYEFGAQYPSVQKRTGHSFLGIGVAVPRDWTRVQNVG